MKIFRYVLNFTTCSTYFLKLILDKTARRIKYFPEYSDTNDICLIVLRQRLTKYVIEKAPLKFPSLLLSLFLFRRLNFSQKQKVNLIIYFIPIPNFFYADSIV